MLGVPEIGKGTYAACEHLCEGGCGIYADRPGSCRAFECQWLRGLLEVDGSIDTALRPDACGVIFDYEPESPFGEVFLAWEVEPGASTRGRAGTVVDELAESFLVLVTTPGSDGGRGPAGRRLLGPPHLVRRASDLMWSRGPGPA